ncbi:spore germination protein [uncultured Ruminococcus sp.]|uniref:spore germination protein n=1 Tax=uncultured Ruminococcus sp. TaxID=165186 RepID=UPI0026304CA9|nr:spore germination protein [uncultured Ruminococcus sp.]
MSQNETERLLNQFILPDLSQNLRQIRTIAEGSSDLLVNEFVLSGMPAALLCCEGMLSTATITELILHPITHVTVDEPTAANVFAYIRNHQLYSTDRAEAKTYRDLFRFLNSGFAVLVLEGADSALVFGVQGYDKRSVSEPSGEDNVMGAKDGFIEVVRVNMSLLRRRMKSPQLKLELFVKGSKSQTDLCLCYMADRVPKALIAQIKARLDEMELESILSSGYLQPFLENRRGCLFDTIGTTQRPDVLCAKLLEGRVGLLIDGTPFALVIPKLFCESFQTMDDYCYRPSYATLVRWIKYAAFLVAVLLPSLYLAIALHHPELLNRTLLLILADAEQNAPISLTAEAIGVLVIYEIIREAGLRLPKAVGGAVSIVAGLIIGDAAVSSGLISTPMLTVTAIAVIAGFVVPDLAQSVTLLRLAFILAGGFLGLFGISLLGAAVLFNLCAGESFGFPIMAPLAPLYPAGLRDTATRVGFRKMQSGNFTVEDYHE